MKVLIVDRRPRRLTIRRQLELYGVSAVTLDIPDVDKIHEINDWFDTHEEVWKADCKNVDAVAVHVSDPYALVLDEMCSQTRERPVVVVFYSGAKAELKRDRLAGIERFECISTVVIPGQVTTGGEVDWKQTISKQEPVPRSTSHIVALALLCHLYLLAEGPSKSTAEESLLGRLREKAAEMRSVALWQRALMRDAATWNELQTQAVAVFGPSNPVPALMDKVRMGRELTHEDVNSAYRSILKYL